MKMYLRRAGAFCAALLLLGMLRLDVSAASINAARGLHLPTDVISGTFTEGANSPQYYRVDITSPGFLKVDLVAEYYSRLMLLSSNGDTIYSSDCDINDSGVSHQEKIYYLEKGTYFIGFGALRGLFITTDPYGAYTLKTGFTLVQTSETESNNTLVTADATGLNRKTAGIIGAEDGKDFFKIAIPSGKKYTLACNANFDVEVKIYTPSGDEKASGSQKVVSETGLANLTMDFELEAGEYCILIQPRSSNDMGQYEFQVTDFVYTPISRAKISKPGSYTYNGSLIKPQITVQYDGGYLRLDRDYTVSYKNNRKPGKASVIIKGIGDYNGQVTKTFIIKPSYTSIKRVSRKASQATVRFARVTGATGYQVYYAGSYNGHYKKAGTTKKTSFTLRKLKSRKYYYVKVRAYKKIGKKMYYGTFSSRYYVRPYK